MDLADFVRNSGIEEDPLRGGRLPGINVGHDADIARLREWDCLAIANWLSGQLVIWSAGTDQINSVTTT
jgi:hypothetical protein